MEAIRDELNRLVVGRPAGTVQELRRIYRDGSWARRTLFGEVRGISRGVEGVDGAPSVELPYFHSHGGREGLQFNVGIDPFPDGDLRYGVAFSFEPSRSLTRIEALLPHVRLFNDWLRDNPERVADLEMWHYAAGERSARRRPAPIPAEVATRGAFVFMGRIGDAAAPPFDDMIEVFDRLVPLWRFVEEGVLIGVAAAGAMISRLPEPAAPGRNRMGRGRIARPVAFATASLAARLLDIDLRHNVLQAALVDELVDEHGEEAVGWEVATASGGYLDAVVEVAGVRTIFEIKTAATARGCVREALGQLLEYGCWPGSPTPSCMVVVGEPEPDVATMEYLARLNRSFPTRIDYRRVRVAEEP